MYLAPIAAIFLFIGYIMPLWGAALGEPCPKYNEHTEGAEILENRAGLQRGEFPEGYDILIAGTSRTMADVDASALAARVAKSQHLARTPKSFNLGNVGYNSMLLNRNIRGKTAPKILILEYGVGLYTTPEPKKKSLFAKYSQNKKTEEMRFAGKLFDVAGLRSVFKIGEHTIKGAKSVATGGPINMRDLYYYHLCAAASGQKWQEDGQVHFWAQLPDKRAGESCKKFFNERSWFSASHKKLPHENPGWNEFVELTAPYIKNGRLVIYRPPVDPKYYALQNAESPEIDKKLDEFIAANKIPFVDFNPNDYFATDYSHLDWYETGRFTNDMADRIAPLINWDDFR